MNEQHVIKIATELNLKVLHVANTAKLLNEGSTVPFIARYRKELTGSMDEVNITAIRDRLAQLEELDGRRSAILKSLEDRELLTDELKAQIEAAETLAVLEDIYLPFRPKRRTRATVAREKGLEPLALAIFEQTGIDPETEAAKFVTPEKDREEAGKDKVVENVEDALAGARDIIAEMINEDQAARARMRELFMGKGELISKRFGSDDEGAANYRDYFDSKEPVSTAPSHRILAMFRGEKEGHLSLRVAPAETEATAILEKLFIKGDGKDSEQVRLAAEDGYKRLLAPSMENEVRSELKRKADEVAIKVFSENLRELLLASPLGEKRVLAVDPGYRTGCKVVALDAQGKLLEFETLYLTQSKVKKEEAAEKAKKLIEKHKIEAIAVGNGTASRETYSFFRELGLPEELMLVLVNESGASVYSASKVAREEFPDRDVTVRGSVSIGRRLMDPLAELVKIDPKSIGVGQYQHDVDQSLLKQGLDDVVVSCVNNVGVDVNTASPQLLSYVSGLGSQIAQNIVAYREENGPFAARSDLLSVKRLGPKAYEQSAGFLRIRNGRNPLDSSAVHPEAYPIVEQMSKDQNCTVSDLMAKEELRVAIELEKYVTDEIGLPTLSDIMEELARPGRDPRKKFEAFAFADNVEKLEDLEVGMKLPGVVTNVTNFGAFVDIGVHQDGLVHISQIADSFVKNPADVLKVSQKVEVTVIEVDASRRRISLSLRKDPFKKPEPPEKKPKEARPRPRPKKADSRPRRPKPDQRKPQPKKPEPRQREERPRFSNNPFAILKDLKSDD